MKTKIQLKRIYAEYDENDGYRILVDRLWPRGIKKENARLDLWLKEIAPTNELRKWYAHDVSRWEEFIERYRKELHGNSVVINQLIQDVKSREKITLLFGARDENHNQAIIIKDWLLENWKE